MDAPDIRGLFTGPVGVGVVLTTDPMEPTAAEAELLGSGASAGRRRAFALGRRAARLALHELGSPAGLVGLAPTGQPLWPSGFVGSITHTGDLGAAVVGHTTRYLGLGLDVEAAARQISPAAARHVCTSAELAWAQLEEPGVRLLQLFSAKEAIFKALYPLAGIYLGFKDAELRWVGGALSFTARLRRDAADGFPAGTELTVASRVHDGFVLAGVALPRPPQARAEP